MSNILILDWNLYWILILDILILDWKYPYIGLKTLCRLNVGDKVRTLIEKKEFEKGYLRNWSDQVYIITKKLQQYGVCWYYLN